MQKIIAFNNNGKSLLIVIIMPHIIKNQFYWLKDNHMT